MRRLEAHFADYEIHHRNSWNKLTHYFGIPAIALALLGLGSKVAIAPLPGGVALDLGMLLALVLVAIFLVSHAGLALGVGAFFVPLYLAGSLVSTAWLWGILAAGVGLQYVGHYLFEGHSPAFHKNLIHTLVGPLWVAAVLFQALHLYRFPEVDPNAGPAADQSTP